MRIRTILMTPALLLLLEVSSAGAAPFIPKMNAPESYKDVKFGLQEETANVGTVQCGGFDPGSQVKIVKEADPTKCQVNIQCHSDTGPCKGLDGGMTGKKQSDGTVPVDFCFPPGMDGTSAIESTFVHELTHVMQNCPLAPGTDATGGTNAGCCATETEAYTAQCSNEASHGLFDTPEAQAVGLNAQTCMQYGTNNVSCSAYGHNPCYDVDFPPEFAQAYMDAALSQTGPTCEQMKNSPTAPVQAMLDEIDAMSSDESPYKVKCKDDSTSCVPIPDISPDLPGRDNVDPLGHAVFGTASRSDFLYPERAWGLSSACDIRQDSYSDKDVGTVEVNPDHWCRLIDGDDKATPLWCKRLYEKFRAMSNAMGKVNDLSGSRPSMTCNTTYQVTDNKGVTSTYPKRFVFKKTFCWDFTKECFGDECRGGFPPDLPTPVWDMSASPPTLVVPVKNYPPNCDYDPVTGNLRNSPEMPTDTAKSFFRHYTLSQSGLATLKPIRDGIDAVMPFGMGIEDARDQLDNDAGDGGVQEIWRGVKIQDAPHNKTWEVRSECYEYYSENDPKNYVTTPDDEQCEIIIGPDEQAPEPPEWPTGDWQAGNTNPQREQTAPAVDVSEASRADRSAETPKPWIADPKSNLSLLDMKKVKELQKNFDDPTNISGLIDATIPSKVAASKTVPDNARTDAFDDTSIRKFTKWWEKQEKALSVIVRDPTVKLIMPGRFLVGLSDNDPLFRLPRKILTQPVGAVELTLSAGSEDFGNVVESLRQQFTMPVQTVSVSIIVPLLSEQTVLERIEGFKQWQLANPDIASEADPLIAKLQQYHEVARRVRILREALPNQLQKLYDTQYQMRSWFSQWYMQNAQLLLQFAKDSTGRQQAKRIWRHITQSMLVADSCQINWCQNQRYSNPVYSLQDSWLRGAVDSGLPDVTGFVIDQPDLSFDFSDIGLASETMKIPSLLTNNEPVKLPPVPTVNGEDPVSVDDYPDLAMPPDPSTFDFVHSPSVEMGDPTLISGYTAPDMESVKGMLRKIRTIIDGTTEDDQIQQEQDELTNGTDFKQPVNFSRSNMIGAYCRFQPSVMIPPDPTMLHGYASKIIHVENDLKERAERLWSRWMPNRKEDFAGRVARVGNQFKAKGKVPPCKEDVVCASLPAEQVTNVLWQMFTPDVTGELQAAQDMTKSLTLPEDEAHNPYDADLTALKRLFPAVSVPMTIDLVVPQTPPSP